MMGHEIGDHKLIHDRMHGKTVHEDMHKKNIHSDMHIGSISKSKDNAFKHDHKNKW